jgi:maltokinase
MKVFRKITPGRNPDVEIHEALTLAESEHVAALYGWLEAPAHGTDEPLQLAMLQQLLRTASDGWDLALASVRDLFAEGDLHADEVGGDFAAESHRLGVATAEVHDLLAREFPTETWGPDELADLAAAMRRRLEDAVAVVADLESHREALQATFDSVAGIDEPVQVQRIHADYHLGQTLRTVRGWKIVDFEGEPAKPLAERVCPDSRWRDVAGMLRSFDYAAHAVEADVEDEGPQIAYRALEWADRNRSAFLAGYMEASEGTSEDAGAGMTPAQQVLLRAYEVDKAVYETVYEARNRPSWLSIPLSAIGRLTSTPESSDNPQEASDR